MQQEGAVTNEIQTTLSVSEKELITLSTLTTDSGEPSPSDSQVENLLLEQICLWAMKLSRSLLLQKMS